MIKSVRAKFYVSKIERHDVSESEPQADVHLSAVTDGSEENKSFSRWTPSGSVQLWVTNPEAIAFFEEGRYFYLDFAPAE